MKILIDHKNRVFCFSQDKIGLPLWELYDDVSNITEREAQDFVETVIIRYDIPTRHCGYLDRHMFRDYMVTKQYGNAFETALESLRSLCQLMNIKALNPYGVKPERNIPYKHAGAYTQRELERLHEFHSKMKLWVDADKERETWFLYKKVL